MLLGLSYVRHAKGLHSVGTGGWTDEAALLVQRLLALKLQAPQSLPGCPEGQEDQYFSTPITYLCPVIGKL